MSAFVEGIGGKRWGTHSRPLGELIAILINALNANRTWWKSPIRGKLCGEFQLREPHGLQSRATKSYLCPGLFRTRHVPILS